MSKARYLTKSLFKKALECPAKLTYIDKNAYGNKALDDAFLKALARGGFQVGELAKQYYPEGVDLTKSLDPDEAISRTRELLKQGDVTLFEAGFVHKNLYVRADILKKSGNQIQLLEVKSKSIDPSDENPFFDKGRLKSGKKKLIAKWAPHLFDIAYQTYVIESAYPEYKVTPFLMLCDITQQADVDGLNQNFLLMEKNARTEVKVKPGLKREQLGREILMRVPVSEPVRLILASKDGTDQWRELIEADGFEDEIRRYSESYAHDKKIVIPIGSWCKKCEFRIGRDMKDQGLKSGFTECALNTVKGFSEKDTEKPFVFDLWYMQKSDELMRHGKVLMRDLDVSDILPQGQKQDGALSRSQRQWLQVEKEVRQDATPYIDYAGLESAFSQWTYPLHFIDFETTMVAIPFNKGRRPYEQIAFQFSHHTVDEHGHIAHQGQWINTEQGKFPNFDFLRALKKDLSNDEGTIFRYHTHENTVLCHIHDQLSQSNEPDRDALCAFIQDITKRPTPDRKSIAWQGRRNMVDLCQLVIQYYYHPDTQGSNSLKQVLPAILNTSTFLQHKYSKPIYGAKGGLKSLNFTHHTWIEKDPKGRVKDPYTCLPKLTSRYDRETLDRLFSDDAIDDGGAAMTAYAMMQFTEMSSHEREAITQALLKYCELDTLAMVMIYEYWKDVLENREAKKRAA